MRQLFALAQVGLGASPARQDGGEHGPRSRLAGLEQAVDFVFVQEAGVCSRPHGRGTGDLFEHGHFADDDAGVFVYRKQYLTPGGVFYDLDFALLQDVGPVTRVAL